MDPTPQAQDDPARPTGVAPRSGHVIVAGVDHLGLRTIEELHARGEQVVAVAPDDEQRDSLARSGVDMVVGDPGRSRVLLAADVATARVLVLTSKHDHLNLEVALAASELNPQLRIVMRLFDQEVGGHIPELFPDAVALSASAVAAPGFISAALDGESGTRIHVAGRVLAIRDDGAAIVGARSLPIAKLAADGAVELLPDRAAMGQGLVHLDVMDERQAAGHQAAERSPGRRSRLRHQFERFRRFRAQLGVPERRLLRFAGVLVGLAMVSALYFMVVSGMRPLEAVTYAIALLTDVPVAGDLGPNVDRGTVRLYAIMLGLIGIALVAIVYAFITEALIRSRLLQTLGMRSVPADMEGHVLVCGLGSIGFRVAQGMVARGVPVVAIEVREDAPLVVRARAAGIPVVIGDARHPELLTELRIAQSRAVVVATGDDLVNLAIALNARGIRPDGRIVLRLFEPEFAVRVQRRFGIHLTRSVSVLAAPAFAAAAVGSQELACVPVGERDAVVVARLRIAADSLLVGRLASSLDRRGAVRLLAVVDPAAEVARWDVSADELLDPDEEVVVVATPEGHQELLELARRRRPGGPLRARELDPMDLAAARVLVDRTELAAADDPTV